MLLGHHNGDGTMGDGLGQVERRVVQDPAKCHAAEDDLLEDAAALELQDPECGATRTGYPDSSDHKTMEDDHSRLELEKIGMLD